MATKERSFFLMKKEPKKSRLYRNSTAPLRQKI
jgi:hypothetical protein